MERTEMRKRGLIATAALTLIISGVIGLTSGCASKGTGDSGTTGSQTTGSSGSDNAEYGSLKEFSAKKLDGSAFTQDDLKKADITVVNFWSTSCDPCINEMPELAKLSTKLPSNVKLVTACLDGENDEDAARQIAWKAGLDESQTLIGGSGDWQSVTEKILYTPTTLFIDSEGNVVGEAIIGAPSNPSEDLEDLYIASINEALKSIGKPEIGNQ